MQTFVQNVQSADEAESEVLPLPTYNFKRRDGNDGATKGRVSVAGVKGRRNTGSIDTIDSEGDDGTDAGDPHAILHPPENTAKRAVNDPPIETSGYAEAATAVCPECGYSFKPVAEKPLLLPSFPTSNHRKPYLPVKADEDDSAEEPVPVVNCPRCGSSV